MFPSTVGPYRIDRRLGSGGMGAVYEAVHAAIGRHVAIKFLLPEYAKNEEVVTRFFNEAKAANLIEHPSLVQVHDCGVLPDGTAYLIMEYLRGETLSERMERCGGPLALREALLFGWQVADVLTIVHEKNIVHRDLKPQNVMLVADPVAPGGERAKVLDFGIAKLASASGTQQSKTRSDLIMGTPRYMSPEQCKGAGEVDAKTDVYSLGVMLYEMLCGQLPFDSDGSGELIGMHLFKEPPPLLSRAPSIPAAVTTCVHRMLVKNKEQRPSMQTVLAELAPLLAHYTNSPAATKSAHASSGQNSRFAKNLRLGGQTTLGFSVGQGNFRWRTKWGVFALVLIVVGIVSGSLYFKTRLKSTPSSTLATGTTLSNKLDTQAVIADNSNLKPTERHIKWSIATVPAQAEVVRMRDGVILGKTPWQSETAVAAGLEELTLRLPGYVEQTLVLSRDTDLDLHRTLLPVAVKPAPRNATRGSRTPVNSAAPEVKKNPTSIDTDAYGHIP